MIPSITRRHFLQMSSMAAISAPFIKYMPRDKPLGLALVGLGGYATNQLAPALEQTKYIKLKGIVTGTPAKIPVWQEKYKIPDANVYNYQNFDDIAKNKDIDVVYIVLPNSMHAEYVIRAAQAGKHVICEKPMSVSVAEAEQMIAACKKAGKQLAIGYRLHFDPYNLEMVRLSREKVFGKVKLVESSDGFTAGDPNQWRLKKALAGGGPLMDVGIYALQGSRYVIGEEPITVTAQTFPKTLPEKFKEVEESLSWQLEFPGGAIANSFTTYAANVGRLFASAERGWFELDPAYGYNGLQGKTSKGPISFPPMNQQAAHMDGVAKSILTNTQNIVPGEEGLRDMKIITAIYEAAESGKKIKLSSL
jgi:predicted dehydrogenase